jgi:SNF2 family DNA or RNA helicase
VVTDYFLSDMFREAGVEGIPCSPFIRMRFRHGSTRPYKVQVQHLALAYHEGWFALYWEPGTGKTVVAQCLALLYACQGNKVVVVTLASLIYQFEEDWNDTFENVEKYVPLELFDYGPDKRKKRFAEFDASGWPPVLVMGYERFLEHYETFIANGYRILIADESWRLSNCQAKSYQAVKKFRGEKEGETALLLMNGTPVSKDLTSLYGNISLVDPQAYDSYEHFESKHCIKQRIPLKTPITMKNGKKLNSLIQVVGFKNHALAYRNLYHRGTRVLKIDVAEIQKPVILDIPVKLSSKHITLYRKLAKERILELSEEEIITAVNEQSLRQKMMQLITVPELFIPEGETIDNQITETIDDLAHSVDLDETKLIIFANFQKTIEVFSKRFEKYNPAILNGAISPANKKKNEDKFKRDDTCRIGLFNPRSAGAGFNFQEVCHHMIFAEPFATPGPFKQALDRIVRPGQKNVPTIWLLRAMNTFASKRVDSLLAREGDAQKVYRDRESLLDYYLRC